MRKICCACCLYCLLFLSEARDPCNGWIASEFSGTCIFVITDLKMDFTAARRACQSNRADLLIISNDKMNTYIHDTIAFQNRNGHEKFYIGMSNKLSRGTGTFTWLDYFEVPRYQNWGSLQPDGMKTDDLCVVLNANDTRKKVWHDEKCDERHLFICERTSDCPHGYFGPNCSLWCDLNCNGPNNVCQGHDGICYRSCDGHRRPWCQEECLEGAYGMSCKESCSPNCAGGNTACDGINGACTSGCIPGYGGRICNAPCSNKTYGANCEKECTNCASKNNADPCDRYNGACKEGCVSGYKGEFCQLQMRKAQTSF